MPLFDLSRRRRGGKKRSVSLRSKKVNSHAADLFMERWEHAYNTKRRKTMRERNMKRKNRTVRRH